MSAEALKDAKIAELDKQNAQLQQTVQAFSGQVRARVQSGQELFESNNNLRSSNILLEDALRKLQSDNQGLTDRVQVLEREKKELEDILQKASTVMDAA